MILVSGIALLARPMCSISSRAFYNLEPGNVVVPTAVENHSANALNSLASDDVFMI